MCLIFNYNEMIRNACFLSNKITYRTLVYTGKLFLSDKFNPFEPKKNSNSPFPEKSSLKSSSPFQNSKSSTQTDFKVHKQGFNQSKQQSSPFNEKQIHPNIQPEPLNYHDRNSKGFLQNIVSSDEKETTRAQPTQQDVIMSNIGLNRYLSRIYNTTGISLLLTLATSYGCMLFIPGINEIAEFLAIGGAAISVICFHIANDMKPKYLQEQYKGEKLYRTTNSFNRLSVYGIGCMALGVSASPLFSAINEISTTALPMAMGITSAIFGGASLVGMMLPRGFMLSYGRVLLGSLFGLIGLNIGGIIAANWFGMPLFSQMLITGESYIGIGAFSLLIMYDTHLAIKRYEKGNSDHLGMSIQILLDVWNIIMRVARQLAKAKQNQKK